MTKPEAQRLTRGLGAALAAHLLLAALLWLVPAKPLEAPRERLVNLRLDMGSAQSARQASPPSETVEPAQNSSTPAAPAPAATPNRSSSSPVAAPRPAPSVPSPAPAAATSQAPPSATVPAQTPPSPSSPEAPLPPPAPSAEALASDQWSLPVSAAPASPQPQGQSARSTGQTALPDVGDLNFNLSPTASSNSAAGSSTSSPGTVNLDLSTGGVIQIDGVQYHPRPAVLTRPQFPAGTPQGQISVSFIFLSSGFVDPASLEFKVRSGNYIVASTEYQLVLDAIRRAMTIWNYAGIPPGTRAQVVFEIRPGTP